MVSRIQDTMQCLYITGVWTQIFSMQHYLPCLSCMATKLAPIGVFGTMQTTVLMFRRINMNTCTDVPYYRAYFFTHVIIMHVQLVVAVFK